MREHFGLLPGLVLTALITILAYAAATLPGIRAMGALGVALFLGLSYRALFGLPSVFMPGTRFASRELLRIGVVLLGVRLNFALLYEAGPQVLVLDLLVVVLGLVAVERIGKWVGLRRSLRLALAVGSSICGASAVVAAAPVVKASEEEVSLAVGVVSILGTFGALGFILVSPIIGFGVQAYGLLTGATLHEVAQVLAASAAHSAEALDLATLTKLTRVALLAPVLFVIGVLQTQSYRKAEAHATAASRSAHLVLLPGFLVGFLAVGAVNSFGLISETLQNAMQMGSLVLTASAMAGIGLNIDFRMIRFFGKSAMLVGLIAFVLIIVMASAYIGIALQ